MGTNTAHPPCKRCGAPCRTFDEMKRAASQRQRDRDDPQRRAIRVAGDFTSPGLRDRVRAQAQALLDNSLEIHEQEMRCAAAQANAQLCVECLVSSRCCFWCLQVALGDELLERIDKVLADWRDKEGLPPAAWPH